MTWMLVITVLALLLALLTIVHLIGQGHERQRHREHVARLNRQIQRGAIRKEEG